MRGKAFLKRKSIDLSYKLSLINGSNVNYYKSVHHPIPTHPVGTGSTLEISKTDQQTLLSTEFPDIFASCPNRRRKKERFWKDAKKGDHIVRLSPRVLDWYKRWKSLSFCKIWNNLPLLCFLLDPLTNRHCRAWSSMINLWRDSRTCQKWRILLLARPRFNYNYLEISKENVLRNMMLSRWSCFTWKFFMTWFHKILKLILKAPIMS